MFGMKWSFGIGTPEQQKGSSAIWPTGLVTSRRELRFQVRRQRWFPLNVPLMWSAAGQEDSSLLLDWLVGRLVGSRQLAFHEGTINAEEAVLSGWLALRSVFKTWSIH